MTIEEMFDFLEECGIATADFIQGAICAGGYNQDTAERILFYHTGWKNFEGYKFEEEEDEEEDE